jgi:hypothetical protein
MQLPHGQDDRDHFNEQYLLVQEFKNLPYKDEVDQYLTLNQGLKFSTGELLYAMNSINLIVHVASKMTKKTDSFTPLQKDIEKLCKIAGIDCTGKNQGRHNEIVVLSLLCYNVNTRFRKPGVDALLVSKGQELMETVRRFSGDTEFEGAEASQLQQSVLADLLPMCQLSLQRTLDLYDTVTGSVSGQTTFRRLLICMLAISEIPAADLDEALFAQFVAHVIQNPLDYDKLHLMFTRSVGIGEHEIAKFKTAFNVYRKACTQQSAGAQGLPPSQPPPPPPPPPATPPPA